MNYPSRTIGGHVVHYVGKVCDHAVDHFIPNERNQGCPHTLKHRALLGYSVLLILIKALAITVPIALPAASLYSSAITATNILSLTNAARTTAGLEALGANILLNSAAQAKAASMLDEQYFAHQSPNGHMPWDFIRSTGYSYRHAGENLAVHFQQAEDVHAGWMASATHRANILDERFTDIGIGVSSGNFEGVPTVFVVQMFGTPKEIAVAAPTVEREPKPEPKPEPIVEQAPIAEAPVIIKEVTPAPAPKPSPELTILTDTASLAPTLSGYRVSIFVQNATAVTLSLAEATVPLAADPAGTDTWYGNMTNQAALAQGGPLTVLAVGENGQSSSAIIAALTPTDTPQNLYLWNGEERISPKVFGIVDLGNFNDQAKRFYAYTAVALAALLLVALAYQFHKKHPTVVAHATGVLALTILLGLF